MVFNAEKEKANNKTIETDGNLSVVGKKQKKKLNSILPIYIPKADYSEVKKPPINLRIHNTKIIKEVVALDDIKGLAFNNYQLDDHFVPKSEFNNKKYRKVWKWVQNYPMSKESTFNGKSVTLAKVKNNEYYVLEGVRRISALKFSDFEKIDAHIIDYTDIYKKIIERKKIVNKIKSNSAKQIVKSNTSFKPVKPRIKPTPIKKL